MEDNIDIFSVKACSQIEACPLPIHNFKCQAWPLNNYHCSIWNLFQDWWYKSSCQSFFSRQKKFSVPNSSYFVSISSHIVADHVFMVCFYEASYAIWESYHNSYLGLWFRLPACCKNSFIICLPLSFYVASDACHVGCSRHHVCSDLAHAVFSS